MREFAFVLEQTLGHVAHGRNLERVVACEPDVHATYLRIDFDRGRGWWRLPALSSWSARASWKARQGLDALAARRRLDAVFIHTQVAALFSAEIMNRVPTIVSMDATPVNFDQVGRAYAHRGSLPALEAVKREVNRRAFARAAGLVTWCQWAASSLRTDYGMPAAKIRVIPPGVDLKLFKPGPPKSPGPIRVLFVGGELARKGGLDLIAAAGALGGGVELDLVTGSSLPATPTGATVRVHRGLRPQSEALVRLYGEADIFALPTQGDCLPQVIAEAMACGLPVVSTPVGAISELVRPGENGLLVPPGSPAELVKALRALASDPARREAMGHAGLEMARRDHDMLANNRKILAFMSWVAESRRAA
jgi:glycosyltransferase involved in cell wall biosynthesis